jgi:hypothetical protein
MAIKGEILCTLVMLSKENKAKPDEFISTNWNSGAEAMRYRAVLLGAKHLHFRVESLRNFSVKVQNHSR